MCIRDRHRAVYLKLALQGWGTKVGILRKPKPLHLLPCYGPAPAPLPVDLQLDGLLQALWIDCQNGQD
eukprot:6007972-Prorocentrum_lima.AAC.1